MINRLFIVIRNVALLSALTAAIPTLLVLLVLLPFVDLCMPVDDKEHVSDDEEEDDEEEDHEEEDHEEEDHEEEDHEEEDDEDENHEEEREEGEISEIERMSEDDLLNTTEGHAALLEHDASDVSASSACEAAVASES